MKVARRLRLYSHIWVGRLGTSYTSLIRWDEQGLQSGAAPCLAGLPVIRLPRMWYGTHYQTEGWLPLSAPRTGGSLLGPLSVAYAPGLALAPPPPHRKPTLFPDAAPLYGAYSSPIQAHLADVYCSLRGGGYPLLRSNREPPSQNESLRVQALTGGGGPWDTGEGFHM